MSDSIPNTTSFSYTQHDDIPADKWRQVEIVLTEFKNNNPVFKNTKLQFDKSSGSIAFSTYDSPPFFTLEQKIQSSDLPNFSLFDIVGSNVTTSMAVALLQLKNTIPELRISVSDETAWQDAINNLNDFTDYNPLFVDIDIDNTAYKVFLQNRGTGVWNPIDNIRDLKIQALNEKAPNDPNTLKEIGFLSDSLEYFCNHKGNGLSSINAKLRDPSDANKIRISGENISFVAPSELAQVLIDATTLFTNDSGIRPPNNLSDTLGSLDVKIQATNQKDTHRKP